MAQEGIKRYLEHNKVNISKEDKGLLIIRKEEIKKVWGDIDKGFTLYGTDLKRLNQYYEGHKKVIEQMRKGFRKGQLDVGAITEGTEGLAQSFGVLLSDAGKSMLANFLRQIGVKSRIEEQEIRNMLKDMPRGLHGSEPTYEGLKHGIMP